MKRLESMKHLLPLTLILSLLLGLALWSVERTAKATTLPAALAASSQLDPNQFASLGTSPFTTAGTYSIDASKDNPAPTLSGPGIAVPIAGVFYSPSGGTVANDEIAVFTFNSLNVPAGVVIGHAANGNSRPVALLSKSAATIDGLIVVSGSNASVANGGNAGPGGGGGGGGANSGIGGLGFVGGNGGGSTIGGDGGSVVAGGGGTSQPGINYGGGGAFGGNGGNAAFDPGFGGTAYGNLALMLQGGSGGAGSGFGGGGGGGGGAIELGAIGNLTLSGTVQANGGAGGSVNRGGGGAGGGILVHAPTVSLTGSLNAIGGVTFFGGGGGGGRVLILTADGTLASGSLAANVAINGGNGSSGGGGGTGVKELGIGMFPNQAPVAQCQSVTVAAGAACTANASINHGSYDPDSGDTITVTQSPAGPYPLGTTTVELTVTDSQGASSSCLASVTVVDQTAPVVSCPANVVVTLPPNTMNTGMVVNYPAPTSMDNCSASPTITTSPGSGSTFLVGVTTVNVTAKDAANNQSSCSFTVTVRYNFSGFFQPVDNAPTVNTVNAGQAIPVKFSLSGNKGLSIFAAGSPTSQPIACSTGSPTDAIEETVTAGSSSLSYDATTDQYKYVWKTNAAWKGTCRKLVLQFNDGSTREALFQFK